MPYATPPAHFWSYFPVADFVDRVNQSWEPGLYVTSWWRTWYENIRVGGSTRPLSQHLAGLAADMGGSRGALERFTARARVRDLVVVDYGTRLHVQRFSAGYLNRVLNV